MSQFSTVAALLLLGLVVILGGHGGQAAVAKVKLNNPSHPGKCVLDTHTILSPGETGLAPNLPCVRAECHADGLVTFKTCDAVAPPPGCKQRDFVNINREFPACCERKYNCDKHI
ncbi:uncharacterized protein LOC6619898 [Drosophila sechellia]|uniref:GM13054 n=1 Tax=Drosophila sechellia TaxID=7238 RepID=B4IK50_DROSE|nr:uncharacterized protein LOC6619898 [Drosophila sechellia]EDW51422.1 GM13054 [Drosophila sechellia]